VYQCSEAFHAAVANGNEQKAMLIFDDCVFTDDDISLDRGIEFRDYFNTDEDLSIGLTPSNEISFSLFNDKRLLNSYEFGDFLATIGVQTGEQTYQQFYPVQMTTDRGTWTGDDSYPYVRKNGTPLQVQPGFSVKSMIGYDSKVWVFSDTGRYAVYSDIDSTNITALNPISAFMQEKSKALAGKGIFYNKNSRVMFIYEGGERRMFEFVPLGWFTAERPKAPDVIQIDMTCYDWMQKFEQDMPGPAELGITYPTTIGNLLKKMCDYVGVACETTTFINSEARIAKVPDDFESVTMRDVLKWIAEAAGSNARFNRDGKLELAWLKTTGQTYHATGYSEFNPYWYQTKKITRLYNKDTQESTERYYGSGTEGYLIQDNPLLRGVS